MDADEASSPRRFQITDRTDHTDYTDHWASCASFLVSVKCFVFASRIFLN